MRKAKFQVGQRVRVSGFNNRASIICFINKGSAVRLDKPIDGFHLWHIQDLREITPRRKRGRDA